MEYGRPCTSWSCKVRTRGDGEGPHGTAGERCSNRWCGLGLEKGDGSVPATRGRT